MIARSLFLLLTASRLVAAQVAFVPIGDPAYQDIDRLAGSGLTEYAYSGQKPYTRREVARLVASAMRAIETKGATASTRRILERMRTRFAPELRMLAGEDTPEAREPVLRWRAESMALSSPARGIPDDPVGSVDATINPLLNARVGRDYATGLNAAGEVEYERALARNLSVRVRPRLRAVVNAGDASAFGSLEAATAAAKWRNIVVEAGRHAVVFGQGMESGLVSSSSARPLDMLRFTTDAPFRVPILSRVFGPGRGNFIVADLGPNQRFPHSVLITYKLASFPRTWFELAGTVSAVQLGKGAPRATFLDHLIDLIPALKYSALKVNETQFSNKFAGWEYRIHVPALRGLQLYAEHSFDDMDPRRWKSTFWEDGGHVVGFSLQNLGGDGAVSSAFEFHHTGLRFYQHTPFTTGMAQNATLLGNPLGNEGNGAYLRVRWDRGDTRAVTLDAAVERRDGDVYDATVDNAQNDGFRFVKVTPRPAEWRQRLVLDWDADARGRRTSIQLGVERVRNFAFGDGRHRNNVLVGATIEAYGR